MNVAAEMAKQTENQADDLLQEFLTEAVNRLDAVDAERAKLKQTPEDPALQRPLLELLHTAKGACGFLPLPRLEALAAASATLVDTIYDRRIEPTPGIVMLVFGILDRLRELLDAVSDTGQEPQGNDSVLVSAINAMVSGVLPPSALPRSILYPEEAEEPQAADSESLPEGQTPAFATEDEPAVETVPAPRLGTAFLLFRVEDAVLAVDAADVEWLDLLDREPETWNEGAAEIPFQGASLRLVGDEGLMTRKPGGPWPMIVLSRDGNRIGFIVDEILNVVAEPSLPSPAAGAEEKTSNKTAAEVIDVTALFG